MGCLPRQSLKSIGTGGIATFLRGVCVRVASRLGAPVAAPVVSQFQTVAHQAATIWQAQHGGRHAQALSGGALGT